MLRTNPEDGTTTTTVIKEYSNGAKEIDETTSKGEDHVPIDKVPAVMAHSVPVNSVVTVPSGSSSTPDRSVYTTVINVGGNAVRNNKKARNCMATAAMVCGIVGLFFFGVVLGVLAIIFGCVAQGQIDKEPGKYKSSANCQATAGVVLGLTGVVAWALILAFYW